MKRIWLVVLGLFISCTAINKVQKFYEEGNYLAAKKNCLEILARDSLNVDAHFVLGKCYRHEGQLDSAIQSFQTAWQIRPESKTTPLAKKELVGTRIIWADTLLAREKPQAARDELLAVIDLDTTHVPALQRLGNYYFHFGLLDMAVEYYQKALSVDPGAAESQQKMTEIETRTAAAEKASAAGIASYQKYRYRKAVKSLEKALAAKPDHRTAKYYLAMSRGSILFQQDSKSRLWDAIAEFGKAMAVRPESGEPHYFMALAYEKKEKEEFENAIEEFQIALEKEPNGWFANHARKKLKKLIKTRDILKKFWGK